jgi:hypothetical protein
MNDWNYDQVQAYITSGFVFRKFQALEFVAQSVHRLLGEAKSLSSFLH